MSGGIDERVRWFRDALRASPGAAYRDWFRLQERLRRQGDGETARALADVLWQDLPSLSFGSPEQRARFLHGVAVFFGSPGPAADLSRARRCFTAALEHFTEHSESGWRARALHNLATAFANLGENTAEIEESVRLFEQALEWRTTERAIARGVTLHNMGLALRRLAARDPGRARELLEKSAAALREAVEIRRRHGLAEGHALSLLHLGITLARLGETGRSSRE